MLLILSYLVLHDAAVSDIRFFAVRFHRHSNAILNNTLKSAWRCISYKNMPSTIQLCLLFVCFLPCNKITSGLFTCSLLYISTKVSVIGFNRIYTFFFPLSEYTLFQCFYFSCVIIIAPIVLSFLLVCYSILLRSRVLLYALQVCTQHQIVWNGFSTCNYTSFMISRLNTTTGRTTSNLLWIILLNCINNCI